MEMKSFLEQMEERGETGNLLFEEGKEGAKVDKAFQDELKEKGLNYSWIYQPEGYDLVVMEHDKDGEKKGSWSMAFFTQAEKGGAGEEEDWFKKEGMNEAAEVGMKMLDQVTGNFLDIVQLAIEVASNKKYKKSFSSALVRQAAAAAKSKK